MCAKCSVQKHEKEQTVDAEVHDRATQSGAHLSLRVDAMLEPHDGAVARPGVPEDEGEGDQTGSLVNYGPDKEDEADEVGEEDAAAVALQDECCGWCQRLQLPLGAEDEGESGGRGDDIVDEKGRFSEGEHR